MSDDGFSRDDDKLDGQQRVLTKEQALESVLSSLTDFCKEIDPESDLSEDLSEDSPTDVSIEKLMGYVEELTVKLDLDKEHQEEHKKKYLCAINNIIRILSQTPCAEVIRGEISELQVQVEKISNTDQPISTAQLNKQFALISHCMNSVESVLKENESKDAEFDEQLNLDIADSMVGLINRMALPKDMREKTDDIKDRLRDDFNIRLLPAEIGSISEIIEEVTEHNKMSMEVFVNQVSDRVKNMQKFLVNQHEAESSELDGVQILEESINEQISSIHETMKEVGSVDEISSVIEDTLDSVLQTVAKHHEESKVKAQEKAEKIENLETQLKKTRERAEQLSLSLSEQRHVANHDQLTELPNREAYNRRLDSSIARADKYEQPLLLAVCDIDFFKKINDTYGHLAGDKVLRKVSSLLKKEIRAVDFIARYGGEEFVFIFENADLEEGKEILRSLKARVEEFYFHFRGTPVPITMSFGLAEYVKSEGADEFFHRADKMLYQAKSAGRNCIIVEDNDSKPLV